MKDIKRKNGTLHHIEIYSSDLDRAIKFWSWLLTEKFTYKIFQKWKEGISYKLNDTYIVFVQTDEKHNNTIYHRKKTGLNHLAFHCEGKQFVDDLTNELKDKGITILYADKHPYAAGKDYYAVFFEDPDRIKVEVVAD